MKTQVPPPATTVIERVLRSPHYCVLAAVRLGLSHTQVRNLALLARYLRTLPADYADFDMEYFNSYDCVPALARTLECGAVACAVGHGPAAGVPAQTYESWPKYADRAFGPQWYDYLFSAGWASYDNTPRGAAARIAHLLDVEQPAPDPDRDSADYYPTAPALYAPYLA